MMFLLFVLRFRLLFYHTIFLLIRKYHSFVDFNILTCPAQDSISVKKQIDPDSGQN